MRWGVRGRLGILSVTFFVGTGSAAKKTPNGLDNVVSDSTTFSTKDNIRGSEAS